MTSKIRIKMGAVEVEYEGSEEFLREELRDILSAVVELHRHDNDNGSNGFTEDDPIHTGGNEDRKGFTGTTGTVAAKLAAKSGSDLVIAAAARLTLALGQESFSRDTLRKEMQTAKAYYKASYTKNLSAILKTLITADKLREVAKETYALSAVEMARLEAQLGC